MREGHDAGVAYDADTDDGGDEERFEVDAVVEGGDCGRKG